MRAADADILIVPGYQGSGPDHWQSRWERKLSTARRVKQANWDSSDKDEWLNNLIASAKLGQLPVVLVAHGLGAVAAVHVAPFLSDVVRGAFLVAPPDLSCAAVPHACRSFAPTPRDPLPFPAFLVASRDDPFCRYDNAEGLAADWGALLVDAGAAGHLDSESGHGPWPEGLLLFSRLLRNLRA